MSDRKYQQRGYQQRDERDGGARGSGGRPGPPGAPPERKEGPRGRGLGAPTATSFRCAVCGRKQEPPGIGALAATCVQCGTDLHTCTHCAFFDTSAPHECRKPVAVKIAKKAKRNECELFEAKTAVEFKADSDTPASAKSAWDALFKL